MHMHLVFPCCSFGDNFPPSRASWTHVALTQVQNFNLVISPFKSIYGTAFLFGISDPCVKTLSMSWNDHDLCSTLLNFQEVHILWNIDRTLFHKCVFVDHRSDCVESNDSNNSIMYLLTNTDKIYCILSFHIWFYIQQFLSGVKSGNYYL